MRVAPILEQLLKKYPESLQIVFKNYPLKSHKFAAKAATAALAAGRQGKFWEFHDGLFKNFRSLSDQKIDEISSKLGLNEDRFKKDLGDPAIAAKIRQDYQEGKRIGVRGIPAVFVNGKRIGNRELGKLQKIIEKELKKEKK